MSQQDPEHHLGLYWGYNVSSIPTFSEIFQSLSESCLKILVDLDSKVSYSGAVKQQIFDSLIEKDSQEIFIFFTGKGLRSLFDNDEHTKIAYEKLRSRFDYEFRPLNANFGLKNFHLDEQIEYYMHELLNCVDN